MANIPGQILFQTNNDAWFTTNAAIVFDDGEIIYHEDGRYKLADGVTALSALTFRGAGGSATWGGITGTLSNQTDLQTALNNKEPLKGSDDNYVTDAQLVVIGNTSGTNTGDNAANTTSNAYADGKVADSITNGVTTIAPSQNAVFDALALKADSSSVNSKIIGVGYFDMTSFNPLDATTYYSNPINNLTWTSVLNIRYGSCDVNSNNHRHKIIFWDNGVLGSAQTSTITLHNQTQGTSEVLSTAILLDSATNTYSFTSTLDFNAGDLYYFTLETGAFTTNPTTIFTQIISQFLL